MKSLTKKLVSMVLCLLMLFTVTVAPASAATTTTKVTTGTYADMATADKVIKQACKLLGTKYTLGGKGYNGVYVSGKYSAMTLSKARSIGVDCSGLVYWTMAKLGYKSSGFAWNNPLPVDCRNWVSYSNPTFTYKNKKVSVEVLRPTSDESLLNPYWRMPNGKTIPAGSVVIAKMADHGYHAWIYLGEFANRAAVIKYLKSIGVDSSLLTSDTVENGLACGGTHWRIEATSIDPNGDGEDEISHVCINNRTYGSHHYDTEFTVFRITSNSAHGAFSELHF